MNRREATVTTLQLILAIVTCLAIIGGWLSYIWSFLP